MKSNKSATPFNCTNCRFSLPQLNWTILALLHLSPFTKLRDLPKWNSYIDVRLLLFEFTLQYFSVYSARISSGHISLLPLFCRLHYPSWLWEIICSDLTSVREGQEDHNLKLCLCPVLFLQAYDWLETWSFVNVSGW